MIRMLHSSEDDKIPLDWHDSHALQFPYKSASRLINYWTGSKTLLNLVTNASSRSQPYAAVVMRIKNVSPGTMFLWQFPEYHPTDEIIDVNETREVRFLVRYRGHVTYDGRRMDLAYNEFPIIINLMRSFFCVGMTVEYRDSEETVHVDQVGPSSCGFSDESIEIVRHGMESHGTMARFVEQTNVKRRRFN
jgi:hypothetical protein